MKLASKRPDWSGIWLIVAIAFNCSSILDGYGAAIELQRLLVERTLSFDNLFVFLLIFSYFKVPSIYQYKILFWA